MHLSNTIQKTSNCQQLLVRVVVILVNTSHTLHANHIKQSVNFDRLSLAVSSSRALNSAGSQPLSNNGSNKGIFFVIFLSFVFVLFQVNRPSVQVLCQSYTHPTKFDNFYQPAFSVFIWAILALLIWCRVQPNISAFSLSDRLGLYPFTTGFLAGVL